MTERLSIEEVVPQAQFIEDVAEFVQDRSPSDVIREVRETLQRYQYVFQQLAQQHQRLTMKEPEIKKCLDSISLLLNQRDAGEESTVVDFSLAAQVYAKAKLNNVGSVGLWLGANVMVEYGLEEAKELLERQLQGCREQLKTLQHEFDYVKDQITTVEVSLARVYNYDVSRRKEVKS